MLKRIYIKIIALILVILSLGNFLLIPSSNESKKYLTWEVPEYAFVNNQMVLHVSAHMFNPTNRIIVGPDIRFPPIYGTKVQYIPLSKVFNIEKTKYNGSAVEVDTVNEAVSSESEFVKITNNKDSFWDYMFIRFIIYVFVIGGKWRQQAHQIINQYKPLKGGLIENCVNIAMNQYPISNSVGIHLRTWSVDTSLAKEPSHECETIHRINPLKLLWLCRTETDELHNAIANIPINAPIFIATDNTNSVIIHNFKNKNKERNIYLIDYEKLLNDCYTNGTFSKEFMRVHSLALIDSQLLAKSHIFIGNMFSTFSNIVAIKRSNNTYFMQTTSQYILAQYLFYWVALGLVIIFMVITIAIRKLKRAEYTSIDIYKNDC